MLVLSPLIHSSLVFHRSAASPRPRAARPRLSRVVFSSPDLVSGIGRYQLIPTYAVRLLLCVCGPFVTRLSLTLREGEGGQRNFGVACRFRIKERSLTPPTFDTSAVSFFRHRKCSIDRDPAHSPSPLSVRRFPKLRLATHGIRHDPVWGIGYVFAKAYNDVPICGSKRAPLCFSRGPICAAFLSSSGRAASPRQ